MQSLERHQRDFDELNTVAVGVNVDSIPSKKAWADILGDWREEIIVSIEGELRIYTTTIPAIDRRVCLMQDPIYRLDVAHLSMGYAQPPMTSFCLDNTSTE